MTAHPAPDLLALIALGEDVEPEIFAHVSECRACFAEIEALQQVVAVGRSLGPEDRLASPSPHVWQRITAELDGQVVPMRSSVDLLERPAGSTPAAGAHQDQLAARRRQAPRRWATVAVAAASALVVGLAGGFLLKGLTDANGSGVSAATQLNALPGWAGANGRATIEDGENGQRTLVVTMDLPPTVEVDGTMEVWMSDTRAQDMLAMGTMTGLTARLPVPAAVDLATHPIIDVSLEPKNDTDPAHSDVSVVRGRLNV